MVASGTPLTGDPVCNPGMCPDWESNRQYFGFQDGAQSTEPHQPGLPRILDPKLPKAYTMVLVPHAHPISPSLAIHSIIPYPAFKFLNSYLYISEVNITKQGIQKGLYNLTHVSFRPASFFTFPSTQTAYNSRQTEETVVLQIHHSLMCLDTNLLNNKYIYFGLYPQFWKSYIHTFNCFFMCFTSDPNVSRKAIISRTEMMEMFFICAVQYRSHYLHGATAHLKYGYCDWRKEFTFYLI